MIAKNQINFEQTRKKAVSGDLQAKFDYAHMLTNGLGCQQNPYLASNVYLTIIEEVEESVKNIEGKSKKTKEDKDKLKEKKKYLSEANVELALLYLFGKGVEEDHEKAFAILKKEAKSTTPDEGSMRAKYWAGYCKEHGFGVKKDLEAAIDRYYMPAAKGGDPDAQLKVAQYQKWRTFFGKRADYDNDIYKSFKAVLKNPKSSGENLLAFAHFRASEPYTFETKNTRKKEFDEVIEKVKEIALNTKNNDLKQKAELEEIEWKVKNDDNLYLLTSGYKKFTKDTDSSHYYFAAARAFDAHLAGVNNGLVSNFDSKKTINLPVKPDSDDVFNAVEYYFLALSKGHDLYKTRAFDALEGFANLGIVSAQLKLAECYRLGLGCAPNIEKSFDWIKEAADKGDLEAKLKYADFFRDGIDDEKTGLEVKVEYDKAYEQYKNIYNQALGNPKILIKSLLRLFICHLNGEGVEKNKENADRCFNSAIEVCINNPQVYYQDNGGGQISVIDPEIATFMAEVYARGHKQPEVPRYPAMQEKLLEGAAEQNDLNAICKLANLRKQQGQYKKAGILYRKAANMGDIEGRLGMAILILDDKGAKKNEEFAFSEFKKLAEKSPLAKNYLGVCYFKNKGGAGEHPKKAFKLFEQAHNAGIVKATYNLARCYQQGKGVSKDEALAEYYYAEAAKKDNGYASFRLGEIREKDLLNSKIKAKGVFDLYQDAIYLGVREAYEAIERIALEGPSFNNKKEKITEEQQKKIDELTDLSLKEALKINENNIPNLVLFQQKALDNNDYRVAVSLYKNYQSLGEKEQADKVKSTINNVKDDNGNKVLMGVKEAFKQIEKEEQDILVGQADLGGLQGLTDDFEIEGEGAPGQKGGPGAKSGLASIDFGDASNPLEKGSKALRDLSLGGVSPNADGSEGVNPRVDLKNKISEMKKRKGIEEIDTEETDEEQDQARRSKVKVELFKKKETDPVEEIEEEYNKKLSYSDPNKVPKVEDSVKPGPVVAKSTVFSLIVLAITAIVTTAGAALAVAGIVAFVVSSGAFYALDKKEIEQRKGNNANTKARLKKQSENLQAEKLEKLAELQSAGKQEQSEEQEHVDGRQEGVEPKGKIPASKLQDGVAGEEVGEKQDKGNQPSL